MSKHTAWGNIYSKPIHIYSDERSITKICPICGKKFLIYDVHTWAYKAGFNSDTSSHKAGWQKYFYCSWHCLRKAEKSNAKKCERCGKVIEGTPGRSTPKYCTACSTEIKRERLNARSRKRYKEDDELRKKRKEYSKKYQKEHREWQKEYQRKRYRERMAEQWKKLED